MGPGATRPTRPTTTTTPAATTRTTKSDAAATRPAGALAAGRAGVHRRPALLALRPLRRSRSPHLPPLTAGGWLPHSRRLGRDRRPRHRQQDAALLGLPQRRHRRNRRPQVRNPLRPGPLHLVQGADRRALGRDRLRAGAPARTPTSDPRVTRYHPARLRRLGKTGERLPVLRADEAAAPDRHALVRAPP